MDENLERILRECRSVAVVGWSPREERPSHWIADYLERTAGYTVYRINPAAPATAERAVLPELSALPGPVDVVDVFRAPEYLPAIVEEAIRIGARVVWMQPGAENEAAAARAREAGLEAVVGHCMYAEHRRLIGTPEPPPSADPRP